MSYKTKEEFWSAVVKKYPDFEDEDHVIKQTSRGLRALISQAFTSGHDQGFLNGKAMGHMEAERKQRATPGDPMDIFSSVFRKGRP